jgi:type I restriction enzyme S subunit
MNQEKMNSIMVALPPLAEQKRIVAKIEELLPKVEEYGKAQDALNKLNEELPEKLKKSVLQEAIEGRLVPQDPNDEPASLLLERIREEKKRLVKEGKLKKKDLEETPISEDEIPFDIPDSWVWSRLGDHISATSGLAYKKDDLGVVSSEYVRVLRGGNISFGSWSIKGDDVMIGKQFIDDELLLKKGTFISPAVTSLEHMGKTALIREDQHNVVAGGFVLMFHPHYYNERYLEYLNIFFQSGYYREKCKSITNKSGQAFYNLSRAKLLEVPIPLPPLAEQKRIVAKIEEAFKAIDALS